MSESDSREKFDQLPSPTSPMLGSMSLYHDPFFQALSSVRIELSYVNREIGTMQNWFTTISTKLEDIDSKLVDLVEKVEMSYQDFSPMITPQSTDSNELAKKHGSACTVGQPLQLATLEQSLTLEVGRKNFDPVPKDFEDVFHEPMVLEKSFAIETDGDSMKKKRRKLLFRKKRGRKLVKEKLEKINKIPAGLEWLLGESTSNPVKSDSEFKTRGNIETPLEEPIIVTRRKRSKNISIDSEMELMI